MMRSHRVTDIWDDKHGVADDGIIIKDEGLEPDLFDQSVEIRR